MPSLRTLCSRTIGRASRAVWLALGLALAGCGGGGGDAGGTVAVTPPAAPARIEIAPNTVLLTAPGASKTLAARVFDAAGNPLSTPVEWSSSRPAEVAVSSAGVVTASGAGGASQITARIGTLASTPLLAVHTTVPAGTVLLTDAQITGDLVETNPDAEPALGNTYIARLVGVAAPAVGQLVMNTESKPVAGRVTAVESANGEHRVTLALVSAPEMFPNLALDEAIDLNLAEVDVPAALRDQYEITRTGNTFTFTPKPGQFVLAGAQTGRAGTASASRERPQATATPVGTAALPPFTECKVLVNGSDPTKAPLGLPVALSIPPAFTFTLNNRLDVKYSSATGLERFVIHGEPSFNVSAGLKATVAFDANISCEVELLIIRIPVGGPLSLIIGGLVPVGAGVEFGGKVTLASMGVTANYGGKTTFDVGIACPGGGDCSLVKAFGEFNPKPSFIQDVPSLGDLRYEPSFGVYAFAKASIGNPFLKKFKFDALSVKLGTALRGSFAPMSTQIEDPLYKSDYKVVSELRAGAGTQLSGLAAMLGLRSLSAIDLLLSATLGSSPVGTVAADKTSFARGESVNFKVTMDPTKLDFLPVVGPYNVRDIVLVRRIDITTQQEVGRIRAVSGQTEFNFPVTANDGGRADEFYAFVVTALAPLDLLALEIGRVSPPAAPVIVNAGGAGSGTVGLPFSLTANATGGTGTYSWSVSSGELPPGLSLGASTGTISGTPATAGTFSAILRATSGETFGELATSFTIASDVARLTVHGASDTGNVVVTTTLLNSGQVGRPYRGRVLAHGASSGGWTGRVTSNPAGIDCTFSDSSTLGSCFFDFPVGTRVQLFASEDGGSTHVRWGRPCDGTLYIGTCTVTMSSSGTVVSFFRNGNWEAIAVNAPLTPGLTLDPVSGFITGTPTAAISPTLKFRSSGGGQSDESINIRLEIRP